ncbi:MAG: hemolysin family protein [Rhodospirillales bacterium]
MLDRSPAAPAAPARVRARRARVRAAGFWSGLRGLFGGRGEPNVRASLEELIENGENGGGGEDAETDIGHDERRLLANILNLRGRTIEDVMAPRADIIAAEVDTPMEGLIKMFDEAGHSRLPIYRDGLDNALGMIHVKDVLAWRRESGFDAAKILRGVLFVSPSMQVLELLLEMRATRRHMALVVDEHGGVDGLVTIEDLVEEIVGEIEDEFDKTEEPKMTAEPGGVCAADARTPVEALEDMFGEVLDEEEREEIDTIGGLVFSLAGRVPIRGEIVQHPAGLEFEIIDADPRRIRRLRIRRTSAQAEAD